MRNINQPRYTEKQENGQSIVRACILSHVLATETEPGLTLAAMARARKRCKARVKHLLSQARA